MDLKTYQRDALNEVKTYLEHLAFHRRKALATRKFEDEKSRIYDFPSEAWDETGVGRPYSKRKNGLNRPLPNFCLKVPTGGGKTLLAVETIHLVQTIYRQRQTGLIVWIVPTQQIYRQTLDALKDRAHPYRQHLDMASAGRTLILEKRDGFSPLDIGERLAVLVLMLPSASRANKEALRMFRDSGAFHAFFPPESDMQGHARLLERVHNLETFEKADALWGRQVKTSLGNTIRLLEPLIILDEGHKAYSEQAQDTLRNLNPCMIVELSATPTPTANKLVVIHGAELHKEEMIKLDLHVVNRDSTAWKDTMLAAMKKRDELESKARVYEANTNSYIRPICLTQVERTGKDQRDGRLIHAEDVREYLIGQGVQKDWIAVKSAEMDELSDSDEKGGLLSRDCPIRYIITKQALQEGWDCPFAYVLTILTNPHSKTALTQLVGRILRQPYARKTHVPELDESYVYCFQQTKLVEEIRQGFKREGLEDMTGHILPVKEDAAAIKRREVSPRGQFEKAAANMVLPAFVVRDGRDWRLVSYESDILSRVPWDKADLTPLINLPLSSEEARDVEFRVGLDVELTSMIPRPAEPSNTDAPKLRFAYAAAHLLEVVPNPWIGYEFVQQIFRKSACEMEGRGKTRE